MAKTTGRRTQPDETPGAPPSPSPDAPDAAHAAPGAPSAEDRPLCPCGCGGTKRGHRPGDVFRAQDEADAGQALCLCGCDQYPAGKKSLFRPGHDARYYAAQKRAQAEAAPVAPVPANAGDRPPRASRRPAGQDGTSRAAGSEA